MKSRKKTVKRTRRIRTERLTDAEVARLEEIRSNKRWSYRELAECMSQFLGVRMPEPTLIQVLRQGSGLPTSVLPIRKYIDHLFSTEVSA